jgi:hypothetical protein
MEFDPQDKDIIDLLTRLKNFASDYSEPMRVARRHSFIKQMTEVGLGMGTTSGLKNAKPSGVSPLTGTLLETALILAIVVEASAMAYFYREQLSDFFQTITTNSKTEEATPPSTLPTSPEVQSVSPSSAATSAFTSATSVPVITELITEPAILMVTPTGTSIPGSTLEGNQTGSTPDPKGNNGNHYGQTPKPERTKENNGNDSNNGNNDNNGSNGNNENNGNNDKDPKPTKDK